MRMVAGAVEGAPPVMRRIRLGLLVVLVVIAQIALFPHLRIDGVAPDLGLVVAVAVAYREGPNAGALVGFGGGLLLDLFLRTPLGLSALCWAITGYAVGILQGGLIRSSRWVAPVLGGFGGLLGGALFVLIGGLLGQEELVSAHSVRVVLIAAGYDALLAPLIFWLVGGAIHEPRTAGGVRGPGWGA
jgi:rod shape-determining protein MreD